MTATNPLSVRLAAATDLPFIINGAKLLAESEQADSGLQLKANCTEKFENYFHQLLKMPSALTLIAERDGKPLAYIAGSLQQMPNDFTEVKLYGFVQVLWVAPEARRLRLGQTLLEMFEATLRDQGVHHIDVQHAYSNLPAATFWKHCDYKPFSITLRKML